MNIHLKKQKSSLFSHFDKLFFNHMDAWGVTAVIVGTALSIHQQISAKTIFLLIIITLTYWFGFAINDYFDQAHDQNEPKKARGNFFLNTTIPPTLIQIFLWGVGLLLFISFMQFGIRGIVMFGFGFLVAWMYSAPPFRLKSRPLLDLLVHGAFVESFPYLLVLIILNIPWQPIDVVLLTALFGASVASQLEQQARDFGVDSKTDHNFTVRFGLVWNQNLMRLSSLLLIFSIGYGLFSGIIPIVYSPFVLIMMPLLIHRFVRGGRPRSEALVKLLTAVAMAYALLLIVVAG